MRTLNKDFKDFIDGHKEAWKKWAERFNLIPKQSADPSKINWRVLIIKSSIMQRHFNYLLDNETGT